MYDQHRQANYAYNSPLKWWVTLSIGSESGFVRCVNWWFDSTIDELRTEERRESCRQIGLPEDRESSALFLSPQRDLVPCEPGLALLGQVPTPVQLIDMIGCTSFSPLHAPSARAMGCQLP